MKILVTIPHFYHPQGTSGSVSAEGDYGSVGINSQLRIDALSAVLMALLSNWGQMPKVYQYTDKMNRYSYKQNNIEKLDIIICTTQAFHLLAQLENYVDCYRHYESDCEPKLLGFECHRVLKEHLGEYDYYCYLEDDIVIHDVLFFTKLKWFHQCLDNHGAVLQPNRYELAQLAPGQCTRHYIDFEDLRESMPKVPENYLMGNVMGENIHFSQAQNPHSGCFFLNHQQFEHWVQQPYFLDMDTRYWGPLESAATLGLLKTFTVYKPHFANASFLAVQHVGDTWSRKIMRVQLL
jgi:hypothetical protein